MPIAITEEQRALQAAVRDWAKSVDPIAAVRRLEPGSGPGADRGGPDGGAPSPNAHPAYVAGATGCWDGLAELGIFSIALPAAVGGADGTVADLAAALEQVTAALVPGPVMPTLLAGLLLAGQPAPGRLRNHCPPRPARHARPAAPSWPRVRPARRWRSRPGRCAGPGRPAGRCG